MKYKAPYNTSRAFYDVLKNDIEDLDKELKKKDADVGQVLFFAGDKGNLKVIKHLLGKHFGCFENAFCGAASGNQFETLKYLLQFNQSQNNLDIALYLAAGNGHKEMVEFLIEQGARGFKLARDWALKRNQKEILEPKRTVTNEKFSRDSKADLSRQKKNKEPETGQ